MSKRRYARHGREEAKEWWALLARLGPADEQLVWTMVRRLVRADVRRELGKVGDRVAKIDTEGLTGDEVLAKVLTIISNTKLRPHLPVNGR